MQASGSIVSGDGVRCAGALFGAAARGSSDATRTTPAWGATAFGLADPAGDFLATTKRAREPSADCETSVFPVKRHQAGRSTCTDGSLEKISKNWPGNRGSICFRINNKRPLPQSIVPPSKLAAMVGVLSADGCMMKARSIVEVPSVSLDSPSLCVPERDTHTPTRKLERSETQSDEESKRRRERSEYCCAVAASIHASACPINTRSRRHLAT